MTNQDYEAAIATIIQDYRFSELGTHFNALHVHRWISQFCETDRSIILAETFHILSRAYYKSDKLNTFYNRVLSCLAKEHPLEKYSFLANQSKGNSQKLMLRELKRISSEKYHTEISICSNPNEFTDICVYIDDGLYTGKRICEDIGVLLSTVHRKEIVVFLIVAYSNNLSYCQKKLDKLAQQNGNTIVWKIENNLKNTKDCIQRYDTVWPHISVMENDRIRQYGMKFAFNRNIKYLCHNDSQSDSMFSSPEGSNHVAKVFLEKGIEIIEAIQSTYFRPLGFDNNVSFGFGSFFATDMNISNTCPLVLWWGTITKTGNSALDCWYPLLPRRANEMLLNETKVEEKTKKLSNYYNVLLSVHRLAQERHRKERKISFAEALAGFDLNDFHKKREQDELLNYLYTLNLDQIKTVAVVMYIGRDLTIEPPEEFFAQDEICDEQGQYPKWKPYPVEDPDMVVKMWLPELEDTFGEKKYNWVEQVHQKMPLDRYLEQAFFKLGILHGRY